MATNAIRTDAVDLIRKYGLSPSSLARAAGVPSSTVRNIEEPGWQPDEGVEEKLHAYFDRRAQGMALATAEEIIMEARNGRMFILVDDEDRENEGDLVIPAQMATPDAINFMARNGRGLICLALTPEQIERLALPPMSEENHCAHNTAFTTSIEARQGVTTGISTADRARTIAVAIDAMSGPGEITTPGHVFPLRARPGGVLVRAGHTEAAVDVARLAGLNPSGVICEIMNDDGTMSRLDELFGFARLHGLRIGTIRDLIAYRLEHDQHIVKRAEVKIDSHWGGNWKAMTFFDRSSGVEELALVLGEIDPSAPILVRMHQIAPLADIFGAKTSRDGLIGQSMQMIAKEGSGVIVALSPPPGDGLTQMLEIFAGTVPRKPEVRNYGLGAQILAYLGVRQIVLLTNSHYRPVALDGYGLEIVGERPLPSSAPISKN